MNYQGSPKTWRIFNAYTVRTVAGYAAVVTVRRANTESSLYRHEMPTRAAAYRLARKVGSAMARNDAYIN